MTSYSSSSANPWENQNAYSLPPRFQQLRAQELAQQQPNASTTSVNSNQDSDMSHTRSSSFFGFRRNKQQADSPGKVHQRSISAAPNGQPLPQNIPPGQQTPPTSGPAAGLQPFQRPQPQPQQISQQPQSQQGSPQMGPRASPSQQSAASQKNQMQQPPPVPALHPEIRSVVQLTIAHAHKVYFSGPMIRRLERLPDGSKPHKDDGWTEVWAQLGGTTLSIWDMKEIQEASQQGKEVPPSYINVTDAFFQVLGSVTVPATATTPSKRYSNVLTLNNAGSNLYLFSCPSTPALLSWAAALRLASWEKSRLEEIYTAHLIRITLSARDLPTTLVRGRMEGWARIRIAGQTDWKRVWLSVQAGAHFLADRDLASSSHPSTPNGPPASSTTLKKNRVSALFSSSSHPQSPGADLPLQPTIYMYTSPKPKDRKRPLVTLTGCSQAFAVYPERPELISKSTLMKVEGKFGEGEGEVSGVMKGREGWVLVMPELDNAQNNSGGGSGGKDGKGLAAEMLKWVIALHDTFELYGRPEAWTWDPRDPNSLMFGYPVGPQKETLFLERETAEKIDPREERTSILRSEFKKLLQQNMRPAVQMVQNKLPAQPTGGSVGGAPGGQPGLAGAPPGVGPPMLPPIGFGGSGGLNGELPPLPAQGGPQLPPLSFGLSNSSSGSGSGAGSGSGTGTSASAGSNASPAPGPATARTPNTGGRPLTPITERSMSVHTRGQSVEPSPGPNGSVAPSHSQSGTGTGTGSFGTGSLMASPLSAGAISASGLPAILQTGAPSSQTAAATAFATAIGAAEEPSVLGGPISHSPPPASAVHEKADSQGAPTPPPLQEQSPQAQAAPSNTPSLLSFASPAGQQRSNAPSPTSLPNSPPLVSPAASGKASPPPPWARPVQASSKLTNASPLSYTSRSPPQSQGQPFTTVSPTASPSFLTSDMRQMTNMTSLSSASAYTNNSANTANTLPTVVSDKGSPMALNGFGGISASTYGVGPGYHQQQATSSTIGPMSSEAQEPKDRQDELSNEANAALFYMQQNEGINFNRDLPPPALPGQSQPQATQLPVPPPPPAPKPQGSYDTERSSPNPSLGAPSVYSANPYAGISASADSHHLPLRHGTPSNTIPYGHFAPNEPYNTSVAGPWPPSFTDPNNSTTKLNTSTLPSNTNPADRLSPTMRSQLAGLGRKPSGARAQIPVRSVYKPEKISTNTLDETHEHDEDEVEPRDELNHDQGEPHHQQQHKDMNMATSHVQQQQRGLGDEGLGYDDAEVALSYLTLADSEVGPSAGLSHMASQQQAGPSGMASQPGHAHGEYDDEPGQLANRPDLSSSAQPAPGGEGLPYRSSFAPSTKAAERKAKAQAQKDAHIAAKHRPGRANGKKKARAGSGGAWESSEDEDDEEEEEEDDEEVDSDGEVKDKGKAPQSNSSHHTLPLNGQQPQSQGYGYGPGPAQGRLVPMPQDSLQDMTPAGSQSRSQRHLPQIPGGRPDEPRRMGSDPYSDSQRRTYYDDGPQIRTQAEAPLPGAARQNMWSQVLDPGRPNGPQTQQPVRDTFVQLEPSETMTKAFTPQGLLSAGLHDKEERSARRQEELARETGASLINVPNKPPPPQTGLLGAVTAHERERKREGGLGAALTEREREKRVAEERQRRFDDHHRQQLDQMQQGSMYGGQFGFNPMMNPMMMGMMGVNPMMTGGGGMSPMMTGGGMAPMNPMMSGFPGMFNPQHMFAAQQAAQAYQQAMMAFSVAGSQAGGDGANPGSPPSQVGGVGANTGPMSPAMTGGYDPRMSMFNMPMMGMGMGMGVPPMGSQMGGSQAGGPMAPLGQQMTGFSNFDPRASPGHNSPFNTNANESLQPPNPASQFSSRTNSPARKGSPLATGSGEMIDRGRPSRTASPKGN